MIHKKDISNLTPIPFNFGYLSQDRISDPFLFGQVLQLGPILPVNIGSLYSPKIQFLGRLILQYQMKLVNKIGMLKFPEIAGEKGTRYGELDKPLQQTMKLSLPSLKEIGIIFDTESWPWKLTWEKVPRIHAIFTFIFSFDGILQKPSITDKDHICRQDYHLNVEMPLEIIGFQYSINNRYQDLYRQYMESRRTNLGSPRIHPSKKQLPPLEVDHVLTHGDCLSGPRSILLNELMECTVSSYLFNKLQNSDFTKTNLARLVVSVAGYRCYVTVKNITPGRSGNNNDIYAELPVDEKKYQGFQRSSLISTIPIISKGSIQEFKFQLSFALIQPKPNNPREENVILPGTEIFIRNELVYEDMMAQVTPYHKIRIAPAWPPTLNMNYVTLPTQQSTSGKPTGLPATLIPQKSQAQTLPFPDFLLFCDSTYTVEDYQQITRLFNSLNFTIVYLDYEHFCTINNNVTFNLHAAKNDLNALYSKIAFPLWEAYLGKTTILWFPTKPEYAGMCDPSEFLRHVATGGGFINGEKGLTLNNIQLANDMENYTNPVSRNCIKMPTTFQIHDIKSTSNIFTMEKILGSSSILQLIIGMFLSMKFEKKLLYLYDQQVTSVLNTILSESIQLTDYHSEYDSSCCANCCSSKKKSKIFPSNKSPLTVRDILLCSIKVDLMMDLGAFATISNDTRCFAINGVLKFLEKQLHFIRGSKLKQHAFFSRDIVAAIKSSNMLEKEKFPKAQQNRAFLLVQNKVRVLLASYETCAEDFHLDHQGYAERIGDLDIVNGFSSKKRGVNSDHDAINVGGGMAFHLKARFN